MSSYTDMENAMMWHKLNQKSPKKLNEKLIKNYQKFINKKYQNPKQTAYIIGIMELQMATKYNTKKIKKEIVKPLNKENIYIAGNYSNYQGWIEGALETSDNVLKSILKTQKVVNETKSKELSKVLKINKKIPNCCSHNKTAKICKTKKEHLNYPVVSQEKMFNSTNQGFSMRSSCAPYKQC